eukprot:Nk52_evm80s1810 gene=Nk52_evmTU80s1810
MSDPTAAGSGGGKNILFDLDALDTLTIGGDAGFTSLNEKEVNSQMTASPTDHAKQGGMLGNQELSGVSEANVFDDSMLPEGTFKRDFTFLGVNQDVYRSGDTVTGMVVVASQGEHSKLQPVRIEVTVSGKECVSWYELSMSDATIAKERSDRKSVFEQTKIIWSYADPLTKGNNPLLPGVHQYCFVHSLPKKLPSTFQRILKSDLEKTWVVPSKGYLPRRIDPDTSITYEAKVRIIAAEYSEEKVVMEATSPFRVLENISEAILYREPVSCSGEKKFLFGGNLPAKLVVNTKYCHFIGDTVPLEVEVFNDSSKNVDSIGLSVAQCITYKSQEESLVQEVILVNEVMPGTYVAAGCARNFTIEFDIPRSPKTNPHDELSRCGTILYGNVIRVDYMVNVRLMVHNALDLKVGFPIHLVAKSEGVKDLKECLHESIKQYSTSANTTVTNGQKEDRSLEDLLDGEVSMEESSEVVTYADSTDYKFNSFI